MLGGLLAAGGSADARRAGLLLVGAYVAMVVGSSALAAARFRSAAVGALAAPGLVVTQVVYVAAFLRGLALSR